MGESLFSQIKVSGSGNAPGNSSASSVEAAKAIVERLEQIRDRIASLEGRIAGLEIYTNKVGDTTDGMADSIFGLSDALVRCIDRAKAGATVTFADFLTSLKDVFESADASESADGVQGHEVPSGIESNQGGYVVPSGIEQNPAKNP